MLKTRYQSAISLQIRVDPARQSATLPPLSLQLLLDYAIKHNIISAGRPLLIRLYTRRGHLHVENNLQRKKLSVESSRIGLQNIMMKYKLLDHAAVVVHEDDEKFLVSVPLIAPPVEVPV